MRARSTGNSQRNRGQLGGVSWTAVTLARVGEELIIGLLVLGCLAPTAAGAPSRHRTADPAPQKAPPALASPGTAPDPAPQALAAQHPPAPKPPSSQTSSPRTSSTHVSTRARPVSSGIVERPSSTQPNRAAALTGAVRPPSSSGTISTAAPRHNRSASRSPGHVRAGPRLPLTKPESVSLALPFRSLPKALLGLSRAAYHAVAQPHRDGVLLLLSSLAMGALAIASFAMLRRLRGLP